MLTVKEVTDKNTWETFIQKNYSGSYPFFQSWNWGEVLTTLHVAIYRLGFYDKSKLVGIVMVVDVAAKRGHYLYLRHGPIVIGFEVYFDEILAYIKKLAKEKNASFIRLSRLLNDNILSLQYFQQKKFLVSLLQIIDGQECWVLDITKPEDVLLKEMRKSHRYLVKKAQTMPIEIIRSQNPQDLTLFLPLYKDLSVRKHFVPHKELAKEFETFAKDNEEILFLAKFNGEVIAGAIIAYTGNQAIYRHGASSSAYREIPASYLIQWEAMIEAKKRGKKLYNFWGVAPEASKHHPWSGHTLFKTGFGGQREYYFPTMDLPLSTYYWKNYLIDWISKVRKGY